jgi:hypothetical protein
MQALAIARVTRTTPNSGAQKAHTISIARPSTMVIAKTIDKRKSDLCLTFNVEMFYFCIHKVC